jgi:hypothetical protein
MLLSIYRSEDSCIPRNGGKGAALVDLKSPPLREDIIIIHVLIDIGAGWDYPHTRTHIAYQHHNVTTLYHLVIAMSQMFLPYGFKPKKSH